MLDIYSWQPLKLRTAPAFGNTFGCRGLLASSTLAAIVGTGPAIEVAMKATTIGRDET